MRDYELRRGHWKNIDGDKLLHLMQDVFGETKKSGNGLEVHNWGAITKMYVEPLGKTHLRVDTVMNPKVSGDEAQKTMRAWNDFLELATGYNAKERGKRAQAEAKKTPDGVDVPDV